MCLIQISSRTRDYVIDTLAIREHIHLLNDVFTNPKITKVLHGAESDVCWLQRDFGVYIVNMFDTYHASHALQLPHHGLGKRFNHSIFLNTLYVSFIGYLLEEYCGVKTDKKYQLSDWRQRPLPTEMEVYARMDTHYLLFIYDQMRNQLCRTEVNGTYYAIIVV